MAKIIIGDKIYLPKQLIKDKLSLVKENYERHLYNEKMCFKCENKPDRYNDICATCVGHINHAKTWSVTEIENKKYIGLPRGNLKQIEKTFDINLDDHKVVDLRADVKFSSAVKWTGKLHTGKEQLTEKEKSINQVRIVKKFWKKKGGFIVAAPRSGKTVIATRLMCAFKRRTLILVHEDELSRQFIKAIRNFTNIRELEKKEGRKLVGIIEKKKDFNENWDIVISTYQRFIREKTGIQLINEYLRGKFGLLIVDEAHRAAANAYSKLVSKLDTKYMMALSATPDRKDNMQWLCHQLMGPVAVKSQYKGMIPQVRIHTTGFDTREYRGMAAYTLVHRDLSVNSERNKMLIRQVFADLRENPKNTIIIPVMFVDHAKALVDLINRQAMINNQKRGESWSTDLAVAYHGKSNRKDLLKSIREGSETRVTVAITKMVKEAIDVPVWTHLYLQIAINNEANFYQMTKRICTPYPGKPQPVLRIFVDNTGVSTGCFVPTWWSGVVKYEYVVDRETAAIAKNIIEKHQALKKFGGGFSAGRTVI